MTAIQIETRDHADAVIQIHEFVHPSIHPSTCHHLSVHDLIIYRSFIISHSVTTPYESGTDRFFRLNFSEAEFISLSSIHHHPSTRILAHHPVAVIILTQLSHAAGAAPFSIRLQVIRSGIWRTYISGTAGNSNCPPCICKPMFVLSRPSSSPPHKLTTRKACVHRMCQWLSPISSMVRGSGATICRITTWTQEDCEMNTLNSF